MQMYDLIPEKQSNGKEVHFLQAEDIMNDEDDDGEDDDDEDDENDVQMH